MTPDTPITQLATVQRLVDAAAQAGIRFHVFPSGTLCFTPRETTAKYPALLAELQAHRDAIADYLCTLGHDGTASRLCIERDFPMYAALRDGMNAQLVEEGKHGLAQ